MGKNINIKMGRYAVEKPPVVLTAIGLGSCVAVCLYNGEEQVGALGHVMLPSKDGETSLKRADSLIEAMIDDMKRRGIDTENVEAKIFGGASLFDHSSKIGEQNVESVREELDELDIPIVASEVGGDKGRSVWLNTKTGNVVVSQVKGPTQRY